MRLSGTLSEAQHGSAWGLLSYGKHVTRALFPRRDALNSDGVRLALPRLIARGGGDALCTVGLSQLSERLVSTVA